MNKALLDTDIFSEILKEKNANVLKKAKSYRAVLVGTPFLPSQCWK